MSGQLAQLLQSCSLLLDCTDIEFDALAVQSLHRLYQGVTADSAAVVAQPLLPSDVVVHLIRALADYLLDDRPDESRTVLGWGSFSRHGLRANEGAASLQGFKVEEIDSGGAGLRHISLRATGDVHDANVAAPGFVAIGLDGTLLHRGESDKPHPEAYAAVRSLKFAHADAREHAAACTVDGALYTWGMNDRGCLGFGEEVSTGIIVQEPTEVQFFREERVKVARVAVGNRYTAAVSDRGVLYTWGKAAFGRLGHGDREDLSRPRLVEGLLNVNVVDISCSGSSDAHTIALTDEGAVYSFGDSDDGKLGRDDKHDVPMKIRQLTEPAVQAMAGPNATFVLLASGTLMACGSNSQGLITGSRPSSSSAIRTMTRVPVPTEHPLVHVAVMASTAACVTTTGEVWTWPNFQRILPSLPVSPTRLAVAADTIIMWKPASDPISNQGRPRSIPVEKLAVAVAPAAHRPLGVQGGQAELVSLLRLLLRVTNNGTSVTSGHLEDHLEGLLPLLARLLSENFRVAAERPVANAPMEGQGSPFDGLNSSDGTSGASLDEMYRGVRQILLLWAHGADPELTEHAWAIVMRAPACLQLTTEDLEGTFAVMCDAAARRDSALSACARDILHKHWDKAIPKVADRVEYVASLLKLVAPAGTPAAAEDDMAALFLRSFSYRELLQALEDVNQKTEEDIASSYVSLANALLHRVEGSYAPTSVETAEPSSTSWEAQDAALQSVDVLCMLIWSAFDAAFSCNAPSAAASPSELTSSDIGDDNDAAAQAAAQAAVIVTTEEPSVQSTAETATETIKAAATDKTAAARDGTAAAEAAGVRFPTSDILLATLLEHLTESICGAAERCEPLSGDGLGGPHIPVELFLYGVLATSLRRFAGRLCTEHGAPACYGKPQNMRSYLLSHSLQLISFTNSIPFSWARSASYSSCGTNAENGAKTHEETGKLRLLGPLREGRSPRPIVCQ